MREQKLSSYAFNTYGSDAKLYNGIHDLERDRERLDWLTEQVESGVITMGFELDGGVFLDQASMADMEEYSYREKNTIRDAIDAAIAARKATA